MRILVLNQYYPPDASASAYLLGELTEDLARDHEVCVVAGRPSYNADATTYRPPGVRVLRIASTAFSREGTIGRLLNYATFFAGALLRASLLPRPDLVVTMTDPPMAGMLGVLVGLRHRRPFVQICHDVYPEIAVVVGRLRNRALVVAWSGLNRLVHRRAERVIVVGRDMAERLAAQGVPREKLEIVPTWANDQPFDPEEARRARVDMGWGETFVVMHAGNMGVAQNLGMLLEVAERLRSHPDVLIVFMGDGAVRPALQAQAGRRGLTNVAFLSYRPKAEAQALMAAVDLHVISLAPGLWGCATPSKTYGIMAAGRPFVAAVDDGSEPARIAEELGCGLHVPAGEPAALADAILRARGEPLDVMGRRGRQGWRLRYRREDVTGHLASLLEDVAPPS